MVELVVVITIMMVITVIGIVSFSGINKKSRDSRRISDLDKLAMALEVYKQENGVYPNDEDLLVSDYIDAIPTDPKAYGYYYDRSSSEYSYFLYGYMEDVGSTTGSYGDWCSAPEGAVCNYMIQNP